MTPCAPHRVALASYALGVLDEADSEQLEVHLGGCDECAGELADLLPTADELAIVDRDAFIRSELAGSPVHTHIWRAAQDHCSSNPCAKRYEQVVFAAASSSQ